MQARERIIVAIDRSSREDILRLVDALRDAVGLFKIGMQAFVANGPEIVREIGAERVFLDLKIHDIPNTTKQAVASAASLGVAMLTVHASGGEQMLRAAARPDLLVLGVTVLTSLDDAALLSIGFRDTSLDAAVRLARMSQRAGLRGVVASPHEVGAIRETCGEDLVIVTPGIRLPGSGEDDQRRTTTPAAAIAARADYLVIGRPITEASDPRRAVLAISETLNAGG